MELLYEVWLHSIATFEPEVAAKLAPIFERSTNTFTSGDVDKKLVKEIGLSGEFANRMSDAEVFKEAKEIIKYCRDNGIRIITTDSPEYPQSLKHINLPPRILFAKGAEIKRKNEIGVAVVGCRKPTDHGKTFARMIGKSLGQSNITVVSGLAEGIDTEAHWGALDAGAKTVAVLAGSVDEVYPKSNERLYHRILENGGTIVSERPPRTFVKRYFYQQRNRIIIGMASGTVVVEGKIDGGTAISARLALDENKDIFAVPGNPVLWQSELPNKLISEGAEMVIKADVVAQAYKERYPDLLVSKEVHKPLPENNKPERILSEDEKILEFLSENGRIATAEEIAENCKISINVLSGRLTILCIKGKLRQESGNRYVLI